MTSVRYFLDGRTPRNGSVATMNGRTYMDVPGDLGSQPMSTRSSSLIPWTSRAGSSSGMQSLRALTLNRSAWAPGR